MKIHTEIVYYNVPLLTGVYLFPPVFYNSYHSLEMVKKKCAKLNEPSVQLRRGINYMHHCSLLTMTIKRVNP